MCGKRIHRPWGNFTRSEGDIKPDVLQDGAHAAGVCKLCIVNLMDMRPKAKRVWLPEYVCTGILAKHPFLEGQSLISYCPMHWLCPTFPCLQMSQILHFWVTLNCVRYFSQYFQFGLFDWIPLFLFVEDFVPLFSRDRLTTVVWPWLMMMEVWPLP